MKPRAAPFLCAVLAATDCGIGCRSQPDPAARFAQGETLRIAYEQSASRAALSAYRDAQDGWLQSGNTAGAARAAQKLGATYEQLGELQESLNAYNRALDLGRRAPDRWLESDIESDVGVAHARLGDLDRARPRCRAALNLAEQVRSIREKARALDCLGEAEYHRGNSQAAVGFYDEAEHLSASLGDRGLRAESLLLSGAAHSDLNDLPQAKADLNEALALWRQLGNKRGEALSLIALGRLEFIPGQYQSALDRYATLRDRFETAGDAVWLAACLSSIANVYEKIGDRKNALANWEDASEMFERSGLQMAALETMIKVGGGYLETDPRKALIWFEKAEALSESSGNEHMHSWALHYLGAAHLALGDARKSVQYLGESIRRQESVRDPRFRSRTLTELGAAYAGLGEIGRAEEYFTQALALDRALTDRVGEASALYGLAEASEDERNLPAARRYVESALGIAESLRTEVENRDLRASYFAAVHEYYELYVNVLMQLAQLRGTPSLNVEAFEASERARARSLLDNLAEARVDLRTRVDPALLDREGALNRAFEDWAKRQRQLSGENADPSLMRSHEREYRRLDEKYGQLEAEIRTRSPRYAALTRPRPLSLKEIQAQALDEQTLLLEYALGKRRSYLWVVSDHDYASYELPSRDEIETAATRAYALLTARLTIAASQRDRRRQVEQADRDYWTEATRLSNMLLAPAGKRLANKRLLLVPDGALLDLPFSALPVPGTSNPPIPLLVEHEIATVPSASVLALLRQETANRKLPDRSVAVLADPVFEQDDPRLASTIRGDKPSRAAGMFGRPGDVTTRSAGEPEAAASRKQSFSVPRLASTREEADAIVAAASPGSTWRAVDFDASRASAMSKDLARYRIVHFATHAVFDNENPGRSGILLSMFDARGQPQDGFLRLHDVYTLTLPAELVVLSACNTAAGSRVQGEGLVGIVRGFMYAGAKRVIASHWKVDDESTSELMRRMYYHMFAQGLSPSAALRQAQMAMLGQERWQAPFYWASFALQGEYK